MTNVPGSEIIWIITMRTRKKNKKREIERKDVKTKKLSREGINFRGGFLSGKYQIMRCSHSNIKPQINSTNSMYVNFNQTCRKFNLLSLTLKWRAQFLSHYIIIFAGPLYGDSVVYGLKTGKKTIEISRYNCRFKLVAFLKKKTNRVNFSW